MDIRCVSFAFCVSLSLISFAGCKKSDSSAAPATPPAMVISQVATDTVARIHWLGKKRLAAETNAAYFMSIWALPESTRLEAQTLDKLSLAPWRLFKGDAATNGAPTALLRPLLEDLVQEESYFEARHTTNGQMEMVLAVRVNVERAAVWQTNLAAVCESLTGVRVTSREDGWLLMKRDEPDIIELIRADDWTLVGLGHGQNQLVADTSARIKREQAPFTAPATNAWFTLQLDLAHVSKLVSSNWQLPSGLPRVSLAMIGDGNNVRTRGELNFPKPLQLELSPWHIPTNLVHDPLASFTAIRGMKSWLASLQLWQGLELGDPPDQIYGWGQLGVPLQTFLSAPFPHASNRVERATEALLQEGSSWLATNGMGHLERLPQQGGFGWTGIPFLALQVIPVATPDGDFLTCGLSPNINTNLPPPAELIRTILAWTNLVYYQWEVTQPRVEAWIYISQVFRLIFKKAQLPRDSTGLTWLKAAAPKLGNSISVATVSGPSRIAFVRESSIGFTSVEMQLLVDWLESPQFPCGIHTFLAPPDIRLPKTMPKTPPEKP